MRVQVLGRFLIERREINIVVVGDVDVVRVATLYGLGPPLMGDALIELNLRFDALIPDGCHRFFKPFLVRLAVRRDEYADLV